MTMPLASLTCINGLSAKRPDCGWAQRTAATCGHLCSIRGQVLVTSSSRHVHTVGGVESLAVTFLARDTSDGVRLPWSTSSGLWCEVTLNAKDCEDVAEYEGLVLLN